MPRMGIAETMSQGFGIVDGKWCFLRDVKEKNVKSSQNAPQTIADALVVLREEAKIRLSNDYLSQTTPFVRNHQSPPISIDKEAQQTALTKCGYDNS